MQAEAAGTGASWAAWSISIANTRATSNAPDRFHFARKTGVLNAAMPLFGTVSGQGIGRFARMLRGTGEGQLMVYATARPRLRPDWSVSLDMSEGFRWQEPPTLQILGFRIDLTRYIEPRIREQVSRVQRDRSSQRCRDEYSRQSRIRMAAGLCDRQDRRRARHLAKDDTASSRVFRHPRARRCSRRLDRNFRDDRNCHRDSAVGLRSDAASRARQ